MSHAYTITVYALDVETTELGNEDDIDVDWLTLMDSIKDNVIASSAITFNN